MELVIGLGGHDHAGEGAGYERDGLGFDPDGVNLKQQITAVEFQPQAGGQRFFRQQGDLPEAQKAANNPFFAKSVH